MSLYTVYALATFLFLRHLDTSGIGFVESVVIITQIVRLLGIVAYFGLKPVRIEVLLVLLSLETFVVMGLIMMYLAFPSVVFSQLAHTIFSTWVASLFVVLPSYLILSGVMEMTRNRTLIGVLLSITLEFGFLTFAASTMLAFSGSFGFGNFFDFLISAARTDLAAGTIPKFTAIIILVPSIATYCSLLVYVTVADATSRFSPKATFVLPLFGAVVALGWVFAAVTFVPNTLLSFTVPGIVVVALLWAYVRR
ncbi:MAG: hypothetical protein OK455_05705 [Thaumarchaeota archaeon]|nr:hypothetical protein [Nitrososphaerota archaeon]